jgi:CrcB protein
MSKFRPRDTFDRLFEIGIILKGLDGVLETVGGLLLLLVTPATINHLTLSLTQHELSEDPHDFIAGHLLRFAIGLTGSAVTFAAAYLLLHGITKIVLVAALLRNQIWAYPWMIGFLLVFIGYQLYRLVLSPTSGLGALTIFDAVIVWLTWREWRRQATNPARPETEVAPLSDQERTYTQHSDLHQRPQLPDWSAREPVDSDIDLRQAGPGPRLRDDSAVLAVIAAGGALGAVARYLIAVTWPTPVGSFPVSTLAINVLGCAMIGVLMVLITDVWTTQRLLRPFLGTGVLGGFTTFSAYAVDIQRLAAGAHVGTALLYLTVTPIGALLAVWMTATATRRLVNWRIR